MTPRWQGRFATAALLGICVIWGSTFVVVKDAVERMPVFDFLAWRFVIAAVAMAAVRPAAWRAMNRRTLRAGALLGVALAIGYIAQTVGLERTPASISGFITGIFVVFTPLCARVILHQRVGVPAWIAVGTAAVGLAFLSLRGLSVGTGEAITLICSLCFALHIVGLGEWSTPAEAYRLAVVQLAVVAVICLVAAVPQSLAPPPDAGAWGAVLLTAIAATALAFFVQTWAQAHLAPTRAAVVMTMEPVFAGIFGVAVGGDRFGVRTAIGAALILAAMYLVELGPRRGADAAIERLEV